MSRRLGNRFGTPDSSRLGSRPARRAVIPVVLKRVMTITYFRRFRMRYDLSRGIPSAPTLKEPYRLLAWSDRLLAGHAEAKFRSFRMEMDSNVFPCLGNRDGCYRLMREISCRQGFIPAATWLVSHYDAETDRIEACGTIQGLRENVDVGSIQNIGVTPAHRGQGIGSVLLARSLQGFQSVGIRWVTLEVTANNTGAIRLYQRIGFEIVRAVYKSTEISYSDA